MSSEEKFARAFRSSPVGLAVTRLRDDQFIEVNQAASSFLGYTMGELIGKTTLRLGLWPSLDDRQALVADLTQHGSVRNREIIFITKQGKEVVCEYAAELIEIDGEPCVLSVLLDITARRYMEQALKANEELLRLFVKHTPAAIAMFDTEMRYLQVSDRFLTDYHLEGQDIIGRLHYDVFPNLPDRWKEAHRRILAGAVERHDEDPYIEPDGSQGWLAWESLPWRKADGEIGGLVLFTQVITQRKRAEQALRLSEERFAKIFNLSPYRMGIVRMSDGVILDVNDCWVRETGFSRDETINHVIYDLDQWLTDEARITVRKVLQEKKPIRSIEGTLKTKSGEHRYALASAAIVDFDGEPCYLWAANDITDRKLAEEEKRTLIHDLGERVKELTALHQTARILQDETKSLSQLLQNIVSLLPAAWQYPEVTAARISFGEMEFKTPNFARSIWSQVSEFSAGNLKGEIEVVYLEERPAHDIGPFLAEERTLIDSLSEMISSSLNSHYAQKALQDSEALFRTLTETVSAGIYIYRNAKFIYVNPTAEQLTGYSRDELLGMDLLDLVHPSSRQNVRSRLKQREQGLDVSSRREDKILTKSGEERWMDVSAAPTSFGGEPAIIATTFDITSRKRAEEQLRALSGRMQSAREEEGARIAREIHDELGAALTGLKWDLEGIDSRLLGANGSSVITDVRKQIRSMTALIESTINTVRRISSELRPGVLDDLGLVAAIEWQAQQFQRRTGLRVHWETDLDTAKVSRDGATAVFRIFQEVLTNVLRHSRASKIYVKLFQRGRQLELQVIDDGRGITDEEQTNTMSLGLLGMKERALLVGGEVSITGAEGKGTTVVVRIPLSRESDSEAIA
jgi:PAS domain S-box-containing protein